MKIKILAFLLLLTSIAGVAQDPQFSQFYSAPLYLNPGFTGITYQQRVAFNHRIQWPNVNNAFTTSLVSYDIFDPSLKSGFGLMAMHDKIGTGGLRVINAGILYSYKIKVNKNWVASPGLYFGYGQVGIDKDKLVFGDAQSANSNVSLDPVIDRLSNEQFFDFGAGFVVYNKNLWFGVSAYHLNRPNQSLSEATDRIATKYNIHGGMRLSLNQGIRTATRKTYLMPSFVYRHQGSFQQLDFGVHYHIDPVVIGIWYRGIPFFKDFSSRSIQDALVFSLGMQFKNFQFGYSYDFTISELETAAGGSHEISLMYEFAAAPFAKRVKRKDQRLECPAFYKQHDFWSK